MRCKSCGSPVSPGCPEVRGADGFLSVETGSEGVARTVAYHWRQQCSGLPSGRRRSLPLTFGIPMEQIEATRTLAA